MIYPTPCPCPNALCSYCNESLFFWLDVENYVNLPGSGYMKRTAHRIGKKYIFENAKMQINISSQVRQEVLRSMDAPHRQMFREAQTEVLKLLESDTMPRFIGSPEHDLMIACIDKNTQVVAEQLQA